MNDNSIRFDLGNLGIIEGREKRILECYVDERLFRQRKSYDEYYVDVSNAEVKADLSALMLLAETFKVSVGIDCVMISQY
jgi:hypothetical protein